jgi:hypothetical protein
MVKFLMENGAKVDLYDTQGLSAVDYVGQETNPKIKFMVEAKSRRSAGNKNQGHVKTNSF